MVYDCLLLLTAGPYLRHYYSYTVNMPDLMPGLNKQAKLCQKNSSARFTFAVKENELKRFVQIISQMRLTMLVVLMFTKMVFRGEKKKNT